MFTSLEEAQRLLNKWMSEGSPLSVTFSHEGMRLSFMGQVSIVQSTELVLVTVVGHSVACELVLSLKGCSFEYAAAGNYLPSSNVFLGSFVAGALEVLLPSGAECVISELNLHKRQ